MPDKQTPFKQYGWLRTATEILGITFGAGVKTVGTSGGQYQDLQECIDSFTDISFSKWGLILLGPGTFEGNFVSKEFLCIASLVPFGITPLTKLTSSSGHTLTVPDQNHLITGLFINTDSNNPADSGLHTVDSGTPAVAGETESMIYGIHLVSTDLALPYFGDNHGLDIYGDTRGIIGIYVGLDSYGGALDVGYLDAAVFIWILGGGGGKKGGFKLRNGSMLMIMAGAGMNSEDLGGASSYWTFDVDSSFLVTLDAMASGDNCIKLANGSTGFFVKLAGLGGANGIPFQSDASSFALIGDVRIDPFGVAPMQNWVVGGPLLRLWGGTYGEGSTGAVGPDQRPTAFGNFPPAGYQFLAKDIGAAGVGMMLTFNGSPAFGGTGQWVDGAGNIVP